MRWKCLAMAVVITTGALAGCGSAGSERAMEGSSALDEMTDLSTAEKLGGDADVCITCSAEDLAATTTEAALAAPPGPSAGFLRGKGAVKLACTTLKGTVEILKTTTTLLSDLLGLLKQIGSSAKIWSVAKEGGQTARVAWSELTRAQKVWQLAELGLKFTVAKASYDKAMAEYNRAKTDKLCDAEMEDFKKKADEFMKTVQELENKRAEQEKEERRLLNKEQFGTPGL